MIWKLFIDDERFPVDETGWHIARDFDDACFLVIKKGIPSYISFDHDLGQGPTGAAFAEWLINYMLDNDLRFPIDFDYFVHSQNPIGSDNIRGKMDSAIRNIGMPTVEMKPDVQLKIGLAIAEDCAALTKGESDGL